MDETVNTIQDDAGKIRGFIGALDEGQEFVSFLMDGLFYYVIGRSHWREGDKFSFDWTMQGVQINPENETAHGLARLTPRNGVNNIYLWVDQIVVVLKRGADPYKPHMVYNIRTGNIVGDFMNYTQASESQKRQLSRSKRAVRRFLIPIPQGAPQGNVNREKPVEDWVFKELVAGKKRTPRLYNDWITGEKYFRADVFALHVAGVDINTLNDKLRKRNHS